MGACGSIHGERHFSSVLIYLRPSYCIFRLSILPRFVVVCALCPVSCFVCGVHWLCVSPVHACFRFAGALSLGGVAVFSFVRRVYGSVVVFSRPVCFAYLGCHLGSPSSTAWSALSFMWCVPLGCGGGGHCDWVVFISLSSR